MQALKILKGLEGKIGLTGINRDPWVDYFRDEWFNFRITCYTWSKYVDSKLTMYIFNENNVINEALIWWCAIKTGR